MSSQDHIALLNRYIDAIWGRKELALLDQFLSPDYIRHRSPTQPPLNRAEQKALLEGFQAAFPDAGLTVEEAMADNGRIAFRSTIRATHLGAFLGIPPTGNQITVGLVDIIHIRDNKFVAQWGGPDLLDLLTQLGAGLTSD
jgi:steroid delta-isomerase-like uncharacterized protein